MARVLAETGAQRIQRVLTRRISHGHTETPVLGTQTNKPGVEAADAEAMNAALGTTRINTSRIRSRT